MVKKTGKNRAKKSNQNQPARSANARRHNDSSDSGGMPDLQSRNGSSSESDHYDDDSDDEPPPLTDQFIRSESDSDTDSDPGVPALVGMPGSIIDSDSDSDDDSDDEEMPGLLNRYDSDSSDDDSSDDDEPPSRPAARPPVEVKKKVKDQIGSSAKQAKVKNTSSNQKGGMFQKGFLTRSEEKVAKEKLRKEKLAMEKLAKEKKIRAEKLAKEKKIRAEKLAEEKRNRASITISTIMRGYMARQRYKRYRYGVVQIQALFRGKRNRLLNADKLKQVSEFIQFRRLWLNCIKTLDDVDLDLPDWAALRDKQDYIRQQEVVSDDQDEMKETDERLTNSMLDAMNTIERRTLDDDIEEVQGLPTERTKTVNGNGHSHRHGKNNSTSDNINFKRIHLSGDVVKWLRNGDRKYRDFFIRRMKQLSGGERSRILAKRLNGSTTAKVPIYETYLEQKSGFRILWTEQNDYLLVWYVAKHKSVSRLMRLIDDSKNRGDRQRVSIDDIDEMKEESCAGDGEEEHEVFLDPLGNVPLKVYDIGTDDIDKIAKEDWTPALHLTEEERDVVETMGTVLLLGRSGTGKTICICNRMEFDRQKFVDDANFSQLFIARSPRLCTYVKTNIGEYRGSEFATFAQVLDELEKQLPKVDSIRDEFPESHFMSFSTFKREIYNGDKGVDALIVWTNIRSFIKGSIEAMQNPIFAVSKEDYLSQENFGKKRCRLSKERRECVYDVFLKYQEKMTELDLWDNCDRILALIQRLLAAKTSHPELFVGLESWCAWSKIYVDEVQDYTQAEILLFFHLSGAGNLFLAGDPAQNVTKGVEFRFDDIRSVGHYIAGESRHLIPQKPKTVNVNFRSHAGILNAAAAILAQMFFVFPDSAKNLGQDDGLFQGPRPGVFHKVGSETMAALVSEKMQGTVILTHDENVEECKKKLGGYELVYGIRRAKGLEFKSVIVLDFFSSLPDDLQKPWREMLLGRSAHDFKSQYPEVEGQLKLLYTAVTRCIDRLFFAETASSISGNAFVRWMTTNSIEKESDDRQAIATLNKIGDIENMTMTQDEWLASGITNAEAAEAEVESDHGHAQSLMDKAIYCFGQANNDLFARKARLQLNSFNLRLELFELDETMLASRDNRSILEKQAVDIMERLLSENLLQEARGLGRDMKKVLQAQYPSRAFLDSLVLRVLPGSGYAY